MSFTVVVPYRNGASTLGRLLDSLPQGLPVVVVDDHSDEPLQLDRLGVRVIRHETQRYFAGAVNTSIQASAGDVLILNQDAWLEGSAALYFVADAQAQGYAIAGDGVMSHPAWPMGYVQGTFMYMAREAIDKIGLLNERDYPLWGGTAEWQLRACRAGFKALPVASVPGFNHERHKGQNFGSSIQQLLRREPENYEWYIRTPPALSVIVPCYNYGRYLEDCINSLLGGSTSLGEFPPQSFQSFEIIIVDDASTDETPEVGRALADGWKAIRYIRSRTRLNTPGANNLGIQAAYGKYITILSADDMRESTSLERLYRLAEANPHSMIYDDMRWFGDGKFGAEFVSPHGGKRVIDYFPLPTYDFDGLLERNQAHAGIMFPKKAWEEVGGYPSIMTQGREDWAFNVALGVKGYCGIHVKEAGYYYRREGQGRSYGNQSLEWRDFFVMQMRSLFPRVYKGERPMGCCGSRSTNGNGNGNGARQMAKLAAAEPQEGMTLLRYTGKSQLRSSYWGPVTKTRYQFGKTRALGYVRNQDVAGMLTYKEDGATVFVEAQTMQAQAKSAPALPNNVLAPVAAEDDIKLPAGFVMTSGPDSVAVATDPGAMTLTELEAYAYDLSPEQLAALLDAEKAGKGRKGAIKLIEELLYQGQEDS